MKTFKYIVTGLLVVGGIQLFSVDEPTQGGEATDIPAARPIGHKKKAKTKSLRRFKHEKTQALKTIPVEINQEMVEIGKQSNGKTIFAGIKDCVFSVSRLLDDDRQDATFGENGKTETDIGKSPHKCFIHGLKDGAAAILNDDRIIVGATGELLNSDGKELKHIAVALYTADGILDKSFANDGVATILYYKTNGIPLATLGKIDLEIAQSFMDVLNG